MTMKRTSRLILFLLALILAFNFASRTTAAMTEYKLMVLQPRAGDVSTYGWDVNDTGLAVGSSSFFTQSSMSWLDGVASELTIGFEATAVNDLGQIAGNLSVPGAIHGYFYDGANLHDVHDAALSAVGPISMSQGVNNSGQVVGWVAGGVAGPRSAFLWQNGAATLLGALGGPYSAAFAINNAGQVAGSATTPNLSHRAYVWTDINENKASDSGEMIQLPDMGVYSVANALNDYGVAGGFVADNSLRHLPVLWLERSKFTLLPLLPGTMEGEVFSVNNRGVAVGTSGFGGVLWHENGVVGLTDLLSSPTTMELAYPTAINDKGWIVGYGYLNGAINGFLMVPVPEPSGAAIGLFAVAAFPSRRLRRPQG